MPSNILRLLTVRMCKQMTDVVEEFKMLGPEQYGFRKGRSTQDAVFVLSTLIKNAKIRNIPYSAAFLDLSKVRSAIVIDLKLTGV